MCEMWIARHIERTARQSSVFSCQTPMIPDCRTHTPDLCPVSVLFLFIPTPLPNWGTRSRRNFSIPLDQPFHFPKFLTKLMGISHLNKVQWLWHISYFVKNNIKTSLLCFAISSRFVTVVVGTYWFSLDFDLDFCLDFSLDLKTILNQYNCHFQYSFNTTLLSNCLNKLYLFDHK